MEQWKHRWIAVHVLLVQPGHHVYHAPAVSGRCKVDREEDFEQGNLTRHDVSPAKQFATVRATVRAAVPGQRWNKTEGWTCAMVQALTTVTTTTTVATMTARTPPWPRTARGCTGSSSPTMRTSAPYGSTSPPTGRQRSAPSSTRSRTSLYDSVTAGIIPRYDASGGYGERYLGYLRILCGMVADAPPMHEPPTLPRQFDAPQGLAP